MTNTDNFNKTESSYEKMIEALNGLDFERLHKLYITRREGFLKSAKAGSHQEITTRLLYAVVSTDVCMEVYKEFLDAMGQRVEKINAVAEKNIIEHKEASSEALSKLQELLQEVQSKDKGEIDEDYKQFVEFRQTIYEQVFNTYQELALFKSSTHAFSIFLVTLSSMSTYGSLAMLFEITDLSLVGEVLILALQTIVGLIPFGIGTAGSALWGYYDILKRKANQYKQAGDLLTQLDNFAEVAFTWCTITQMLIELHNGNLSIQDNDTDKLEKMVGEQEIERISKIIQNKIEVNVKKHTEESN